MWLRSALNHMYIASHRLSYTMNRHVIALSTSFFFSCFVAEKKSQLSGDSVHLKPDHRENTSPRYHLLLIITDVRYLDETLLQMSSRRRTRRNQRIRILYQRSLQSTETLHRSSQLCSDELCVSFLNLLAPHVLNARAAHPIKIALYAILLVGQILL